MNLFIFFHFISFLWGDEDLFTCCFLRHDETSVATVHKFAHSRLNKAWSMKLVFWQTLKICRPLSKSNDCKPTSVSPRSWVWVQSQKRVHHHHHHHHWMRKMCCSTVSLLAPAGGTEGGAAILPYPLWAVTLRQKHPQRDTLQVRSRSNETILRLWHKQDNLQQFAPSPFHIYTGNRPFHLLSYEFYSNNPNGVILILILYMDLKWEYISSY